MLLEVTCFVEVAEGWLDINDGHLFVLHADTRQTWTQTLRRQQTSSPFVAGTFTVNETPEDVMEQVSVIVTGDTHHDMETAKDRLIEALQASAYRMVFGVEDTVEVWRAKAADVTVSSSQPLMFARKCIVAAQVPRHPRIERRMA
jgi:hypothetical protein